MFSKLTKRSFDTFLKILERFNYYYWKSNNNKTYWSGRQQADKIYKIIKNKDFEKVYDLWELEKTEICGGKMVALCLRDIRINLD